MVQARDDGGVDQSGISEKGVNPGFTGHGNRGGLMWVWGERSLKATLKLLA